MKGKSFHFLSFPFWKRAFSMVTADSNKKAIIPHLTGQNDRVIQAAMSQNPSMACNMLTR
jgi:hypothetical protein